MIKKKICFCIFLFLSSYLFFIDAASGNERSIVIVTCSYNNKDWYKRNLDSVFMQNYSNYKIIITDDCSTDGTYKLIKSYIKEKGKEDKVVLIHNTQRQYVLGNIYNAVHLCKDTDIIVILDGDDWFAHKNVLSYINNVYANPNIWLTYGQFREYPSGARGFCCPMPCHVVKNNAFRSFTHIPSHLRTFYAGLFKKIKKEDLIYDGTFFVMAADIATMFPMIEMARDHFKFIPDILIEYNATNPLNEHKISKKLQRNIDLIIRSRRKYDKIESPF